MRVDISYSPESQEDLEFFKFLMDYASENTNQKPTIDIDCINFACALLTSNLSEKFRPMKMVKEIIRYLLERDVNNNLNCLILADSVSEWRKQVSESKKLNICDTWEEFVFQTNNNSSRYNFVVIEKDIGTLLFDSCEEFLEIVKVYGSAGLLGFFMYTDPKYLEETFRMLSDRDCLTLVQLYHVSSLSRKMLKLFGNACALKDDECLLYLPKEGIVAKTTDITNDTLLTESLKKIPLG